PEQGAARTPLCSPPRFRGSGNTPSQSEALRPPIPPPSNLVLPLTKLRDLRGDLAELCVRARQLLREPRAVPHLDALADARDRDVAVELGVLAQEGRDQDPALRVRRALDAARDQEALDRVTLDPQRVDVRDALLDPLPVLGRIQGEAVGQDGQDGRS